MPSEPLANSTALRNALLQRCHSTVNVGASGESSQNATDPDRMAVDSLRKGQSKGKGKRQQSNLALAKWMQTRVSTVADLDTGRRTAGDQVVHMTASTVVPQRQGQGQGERKERRELNGRCADEHPFWPELVVGNIIDLSVSSFTDSMCC